ncbi:AAA family ATPase, partial [bacterium]|nr:AAA family ATPase [bacterium]
GKNPTEEKNSCMVLRFNFSKISTGKTVEIIEQSFNNICHGELSGLISRYKNYFHDFEPQGDKIADVVENILIEIKKQNLPPLYIIVDEYDNFTNQLIQSHNDGLYNSITNPDGDSFLKSFFKVIKAGLESNAVRRCYITGVLPITIDDLTSGFNVAEIITLEERFTSMLGFTQSEMETYLDAVFEAYEFDRTHFEVIKTILKKYYNGYKFSPTAETLYNSTILTFFLKQFVMDGGTISEDFIDHNIRTDINWVKRLAGSSENARKMIDTLIYDREIRYDSVMVKSKFNMKQFFEPSSFPVSLFYLGMLTFHDERTMTFPNQTLETIFASYYNEINNIDMIADKYADAFAGFRQTPNLKKIFANYWKEYVGQIPAQAFDKANENFFRTTFYELCIRYLSLYFVLNIESNYPSGRSDLEFLGKYHTQYKNLKWVVEFKHFSKENAKKEGIYDLKKAREEEIAQVSAYGNDILKDFPDYDMSLFVIYTISHETFKVFKV